MGGGGEGGGGKPTVSSLHKSLHFYQRKLGGAKDEAAYYTPEHTLHHFTGISLGMWA